MYIEYENEGVVTVCSPGRKYVSTEVVRNGTKTIFTITFEAESKELHIPEFLQRSGHYREVI